MRVLIAPQEFKGSLTATEAAAAIAVGIHEALPDAIVVEAPMSDGGPGLVDAMLAAIGGERIDTEVHDPLMRPVAAAWALMPDGVGVIEMAAASGLVLLAEGERDPLVATTHGTGELIAAALERHCREIIIGVGGSATVDGGAGAMQALGARLLDARGDDLSPGGGALVRLDRIDISGVDRRLREVRIRVASDVTNTLCGPAGAATMFGPQKGASPAHVETLEAALRRFAEIAARDCSVDVLSLRGGGAAGGLGAGLVAVAGATIEPGFALVAVATGLEAKVVAADIVITGEGRLDAQTAYGKTASGVAALARKHGKQVGVIAGSIDAGYATASGEFDAVESVLREGVSSEHAMHEARRFVAEAAARLVRRL